MRADVAELCPACGYREQAPDGDGFCEPCAARHALDRYLARKGEEARERNAAWRERSAVVRDYLRERQHYSRLMRVLRARRAPAWIAAADPAEVAYRAIELLQQLRHSAVRPDAHASFEELAGLVAWLALGPDGPEEGALQ